MNITRTVVSWHIERFFSIISRLIFQAFSIFSFSSLYHYRSYFFTYYLYRERCYRVKDITVRFTESCGILFYSSLFRISLWKNNFLGAAKVVAIIGDKIIIIWVKQNRTSYLYSHLYRKKECGKGNIVAFGNTRNFRTRGIDRMMERFKR